MRTHSGTFTAWSSPHGAAARAEGCGGTISYLSSLQTPSPVGLEGCLRVIDVSQRRVRLCLSPNSLQQPLCCCSPLLEGPALRWDDTNVASLSRTCAAVASVELFVLTASWQGSLETRPQREMDTAEEELGRQDTVRRWKAAAAVISSPARAGDTVAARNSVQLPSGVPQRRRDEPCPLTSSPGSGWCSPP